MLITHQNGLIDMELATEFVLDPIPAGWTVADVVEFNRCVSKVAASLPTCAGVRPAGFTVEFRGMVFKVDLRTMEAKPIN